MRTVNPVNHEEKRREILAAATRCFARDGLRGASVSSICAEAGISPGHLYHYFESKEAILDIIVETVLERTTKQLGQTITSSDALSALISDMQQATIRSDDGGNVLVLDMLAEAGRNPAIAKLVQKYSRGMRHLLADFLRSGQVRGQIDPSLDTEAAAAVLMGVIDGFVITAVRDPSLNKVVTAEMLHTLITRFLVPPAADAAK